MEPIFTRLANKKQEGKRSEITEKEGRIGGRKEGKREAK